MRVEGRRPTTRRLWVPRRSVTGAEIRALKSVAEAQRRIDHSLDEALLTRRLADYERTCAVIGQLTEVRFKLAAFVPTVTGAAVGLLLTGKAQPLAQGSLAIGGIVFVLGIVVYDLRNTQHYGTAIGRATELEELIEFDVVADDSHAGVFGTRSDSRDTLRDQRRDRFQLLPRDWLSIPVRHASGLALAYGAAMAAWVWTLGDAVVKGQRWSGSGTWAALVVSAVAGLLFIREYRRVDMSPRERARAIDDWEHRWPTLSRLRWWGE
jgi:hypothetical protein